MKTFNIFKRKPKKTEEDTASNPNSSNGSPRTPRTNSFRLNSPNADSDEGSDTKTPNSPSTPPVTRIGSDLSIGKTSQTTLGKSSNRIKVFKQGLLMKEGERIKSWKKRHFQLTVEGIQYSKLTRENEIDKLVGVIPLAKGTVVAKAADQKGRKYCFQICTQKRTFFLQASTDQEQNEWMQAIKEVVENELANVSSPIVDVETAESVGSDKNQRRSNADLDSTNDTDDPSDDNEDGLKRVDSRVNFIANEEDSADSTNDTTDKTSRLSTIGESSLSEKQQKHAEMSLTEEDEYDIAMCAAEIFLKDAADRTPEEQAYVLAMEEYALAMMDYGEKFHLKPEYSLASGTCIFAMPEAMRTPIEQEYVADIMAEKATHLNIINKKRAISIESQVEIQQAAARIFAKSPSERTLEEKEYINKLRRTLRDVSRIEREHGMRVQHSLMTSVMMHAKYDEERTLEDIEYLDLVERKMN